MYCNLKFWFVHVFPKEKTTLQIGGAERLRFKPAFAGLGFRAP